MAERLGEALLDLDTDDRKFNQGVDRAEKKAEGLGKVFDDVGRRALQLGKAMAIAAGVGGAAALSKGIVDAVVRLEQMRKASAQVDRALKNSGNTAQTSAAEIEAWADKLENKTGRAAEEVMAVAANLASFGFSRETYFRTIELADDMAAAWGGDLRQNIEGLSRALDDPINGMAMLSKRGIKLTDEQKAMAAAFLDTNDKLSAQKVVLEALEAQVKGVAEAGFGGLTKSLAVARKVWETAFEDLVTGRGNAADLRDTIEKLIATLSSEEFVSAAMGFGQLILSIINGIADAAVAAHQALRGLKDFLASGDGEVSTEGLKAEFAQLDRLYATAHAEAQTLNGGARLEQLGVEMQNWQDRMRTIQGELDRRAAEQSAGSDTSVTPGTINPYAGQTFTTDATQKQRDAVQDLIDDLKHERDIVGLNAREQGILNAIRRAGVSATSDQGKEIRALITETQEHEDQLERQKDLYAALGQAGKTAVASIVDAMEDGVVTGGELLGILGDLLIQAGSFFMNQGMQGGGDFGNMLGTIFSGFFADGGLIPTGTFGIVGEEGPEPIIGTSRGAMVLPNSSLGSLGAGGDRGSLNITINGTNLTQSEVTQAIADAIDRYDRFQLPERVAGINADPLARG
jgi:hypothetical protein